MIKFENVERICAYALILFLLIVGLKQCREADAYKQQAARYTNNQLALNDSIRALKNREGEWQYQKRSFVATEAELRNLSQTLAAELDKQKGQVAQLTAVVAKLITVWKQPIGGTTVIQGNPCDSLGGDFVTEWSSKINYDSLNYRILAGKNTLTLRDKLVKSSKTDILIDEVGFNLTTGVTKIDDHYEIFIKSNYPGFKPTKIEGAVIPRKDLAPLDTKKWVIGIGPQIGIGIPNGNPTLIWYGGIGVSLQYKLFEF